MEEEKKVIYRFDVDFSGTASTSPAIKICATDVNSRMFIMTPKSGGVEIDLPEDTNVLLTLTKTANKVTSVIGTVVCTYVNKKIVADVPSFSISDSDTIQGTVMYYKKYTDSKEYKLQSVPFYIGVVSSNQSPGTITAADEFKALADIAAIKRGAYYDINTSSESPTASENDLKIEVDNLNPYIGTIIDVIPAKKKGVSPLKTGRMYLLNQNETIHGVDSGLPICVIDPDTGNAVMGDKEHYNPYAVPMNCKSTMRLFIRQGYAIWLNPPYYYAIDADEYLGKNLVAYDDVDWKCKIIRGNGFATVQGVLRANTAIKPGTAGERTLIEKLPFRPMTHTLVRCTTSFTSTSVSADSWVCQLDGSDGSIWVEKGATLTGTDDFCINVTFPVYSRKE